MASIKRRPSRERAPTATAARLLRARPARQAQAVTSDDVIIAEAPQQEEPQAANATMQPQMPPPPARARSSKRLVDFNPAQETVVIGDSRVQNADRGELEKMVSDLKLEVRRLRSQQQGDTSDRWKAVEEQVMSLESARLHKPNADTVVQTPALVRRLSTMIRRASVADLKRAGSADKEDESLMADIDHTLSELQAIQHDLQLAGMFGGAPPQIVDAGSDSNATAMFTFMPLDQSTQLFPNVVQHPEMPPTPQQTAQQQLGTSNNPQMPSNFVITTDELHARMARIEAIKEQIRANFRAYANIEHTSVPTVPSRPLTASTLGSKSTQGGRSRNASPAPTPGRMVADYSISQPEDGPTQASSPPATMPAGLASNLESLQQPSGPTSTAKVKPRAEPENARRKARATVQPKRASEDSTPQTPTESEAMHTLASPPQPSAQSHPALQKRIDTAMLLEVADEQQSKLAGWLESDMRRSQFDNDQPAPVEPDFGDTHTQTDASADTPRAVDSPHTDGASSNDGGGSDAGHTQLLWHDVNGTLAPADGGSNELAIPGEDDQKPVRAITAKQPVPLTTTGVPRPRPSPSPTPPDAADSVGAAASLLQPQAPALLQMPDSELEPQDSFGAAKGLPPSAVVWPNPNTFPVPRQGSGGLLSGPPRPLSSPKKHASPKAVPLLNLTRVSSVTGAPPVKPKPSLVPDLASPARPALIPQLPPRPVSHQQHNLSAADIDDPPGPSSSSMLRSPARPQSQQPAALPHGNMSIGTVADAIRQYSSDTARLTQSCKHILSQTQTQAQRESILPQFVNRHNGAQALVAAVRLHTAAPGSALSPETERFLQLGVALLGRCLEVEDARNATEVAGAVACIAGVLQTHRSSPVLLTQATQALNAGISSPTVRNTLFSAGCVGLVVDGMVAHSGRTEAQLAGCSFLTLLWSTGDPKTKQAVLQTAAAGRNAAVIFAVIQAVDKHADKKELASVGLKLLLAIVLASASACGEAVQVGALEAATKTIEKNLMQPTVLNVAFRLLGHLTGLSTEVAARGRAHLAKTDRVAKLVAVALRGHGKNATIAKSICSVMVPLAVVREGAEHLCAQGCVNLLVACMEANAADQDLAVVACRVLGNIAKFAPGGIAGKEEAIGKVLQKAAATHGAYKDLDKVVAAGIKLLRVAVQQRR